MIDISDRRASLREAEAWAVLQLQTKTLNDILQHNIPKGDVLTTARIAAIQAAKRCPETLPLCHPIPLTGVHVAHAYRSDDDSTLLAVGVCCRTQAPTGVEMEALCGVSGAALCIYDMCKSLDASMSIVWQGVVHKQGGRSGDWANPTCPAWLQEHSMLQLGSSSGNSSSQDEG